MKILILTILIITLSSCVGAAAEIYADSSNPIQIAVDSANPGDIIFVAPGTYTENIIINKNDLVIRSESGNPANTIITPENSSLHVITIQNGKNVTIKGLKVAGAEIDKAGIYLTESTDCTIEDNVLYNDALGIYLKNSNNNIVRNNAASKDSLTGTGRGINIEYSDYTILSSNTVSNHRFGIYVSNSQENTLSENTVSKNADHGMVLVSVTGSNLENNAVNSNEDYGIYLSNSEGNTLESNTLFNNTNSINLVFSSGNTISDNTVSDDTLDMGTHSIFLNNSNNNNLQSNKVSNSDYGIAMRYSNSNKLVNNNVYNNNRGIYLTLTSSLNTLSGNQVNSNFYSGIVIDNCDNNEITKNTARLNSASGIFLGNADGNKLTNNNASENSKGIYLLTSSSGNILSGNTVNSNTGHGIVLENAGSNNNLTGNAADSNNNYGIYLKKSSNNYLFSNTAPHNSKGIYIMNSTGNTVSDNTLSDNTVDGIMLSLSSSNTLSKNIIHSNSFGISLNSSESNSISSNTITSSRTAGIFLCAKSSDNRIFNNYFNNTGNTYVRNALNVWNTTKTAGTSIAGGPYLGGNYWGKPDGQGHSQLFPDADGDGITEEIFSASNVTDYLPLVAVTPTVLPVANFSTNVSSGNAPLSVQFIDLSQDATSMSWDVNNDGVEDSDEESFVYVYTAAGKYTANLTVRNPNGTDSKTAVITVLGEDENETKILPVADFTVSETSGYYPLTVIFTDTSQNATGRSWDVNNDGVEDSNEASFTHTYSSRGTYEAKLTAINENGKDTKTTTITVKRKSSGGSSGGSSSGGGGGGSPEPAKNVEVKEICQVFITNGKTINFDFAKEATCIMFVSFDSKRTTGKTTTIAEQLKDKSSLVSGLPSDDVYIFFNIWVGNSGFATEKNIENPVIGFKVEKAWVEDENIDQATIALYRYNNDEWEQLPAILADEDDTYLYFTAETPGFSSFAITGKRNVSQEETVTEIQPEDETYSTEEDMEDTGSEADPESEEEESAGMPGFEMAYGVTGLLAVFLYKRKINS